MEPTQKEKITKNLPVLIDQTVCSAEFLAIFRANSIFSKSDVQLVKTEQKNLGELAASSKFYNMLESRKGSFDVLLEALEETCQSGALAVLNSSTSHPTVDVKKARLRISSKSPGFLTDYLMEQDERYLIVCSFDCKLTCDWIVESKPNCKLVSIAEISHDVSEPQTTSLNDHTIFLANLEKSLEPLFDVEQNPKQKVVFVTSLGENEVKDKLPQPTSGWKLAQDNIQWRDLSSNKKLDITSGLKQKVGLEGLELRTALSSLDTKHLVELLNDKFPAPEKLFLDTIPRPINYYVTRTLQSRYVITKEIFEDKSPDELVLFKNIERSLLSIMCKQNLTESSSNLLRKKREISRFVYLENELHFDRILHVFPKYAIHLLDYVDGEFIWKKSRGDISNIQKHVSSEQCTIKESNFLSKILAEKSKNPICISDTPGKGKSTLLANLAIEVKKRHKEGIVAFLTIKELIQRLKEHEPISPLTVCSSISHFLTSSTLGHIYLKVNKNHLKELMLDGFDEVAQEDTFFAIKCLSEIRSVFCETRIWITSRPHMLNELERFLETLGYNITPFTRTDQIDFLSSFWSIRISNCGEERVSQFADQLLKTLELSLGPTKEDIAGIPLQCMLIGEVYEDDAKSFSECNSSTTSIIAHNITSIEDLYEKLIEKKLDKYKNRYNGNNISNLDIFKAHMKKALEILHPLHVIKFSDILVHTLSQQDILDFGLVQAKSILSDAEFLHRTFAEYFLARFVSWSMVEHPSDNLWHLLFAEIMMTDVTFFKHIR